MNERRRTSHSLIYFHLHNAQQCMYTSWIKIDDQETYKNTMCVYVFK